MWRDAVARLKHPERDELKARLNSLDVWSLGLSPLNGNTLVQYAGSLTGRDFRIIAQVGPAVLYDLLPRGLYDMWTSMSLLFPLVYQSKILDLESYLASSILLIVYTFSNDLNSYLPQKQLEYAICDFLKATAAWNIVWFNKTKFHLLLHLPNHIRVFGPAYLFATEGFESYNAVIRTRNIHSNRQAPSRDIAYAFSYLHAIRHLVSGGLFAVRDYQGSIIWRSAGPGVLALVEDIEYQNLMGLKPVLNVLDRLKGGEF